MPSLGPVLPPTSVLLRRLGLFVALTTVLMASDCQELAKRHPESSLLGDPPNDPPENHNANSDDY